VFRTVLIILSGNMTASLLTLVRNLVVARLISVEDYGIAATFAVVMSIVEMLSTLGLQQQIIQSKSGNDPAFQASLQGFNVLRGAIASAVLFVSAGAIAQFLKIPEVAWAYQLMALVPLFNSLMHFDIHRLTRSMNYLPGVMTQAVPAFLALLLVYPLYLAYGDYRVMLYSIVAQFGLMMVTSHFMAERRFSIAFDRTVIAEALRFGWPLLINNALLFAVFNGEKLIIGRELGMADLAIFAMGFTLTLTPTLVMAKSAQNFFLPQLAAVQDDPKAFNQLTIVTLQTVIFLGLALVAGTVLLGGPVVYLLLGEKFAPLLPLLIWFAIMQAMRVLKAGGAIVALAKSHTQNAMWSNIVRVVGLIPAWWVAVGSGDILTILWIATAAETLGFVISLGLLRWRLNLSLRKLAPTLLATAICMVGAAWQAARLSAAETASQVPNWPIWLITCVLVIASFAVMAELRHYLRNRRVTQFNEDAT